MSTTPISSSTSSSSSVKKTNSLNTDDFIKMMVTQLQNQDPMDPAKSSDLLNQMSQIGQLQSATSLQDTMKSVMLQSQVGSASSLIGKTVEGVDANNATVRGLVNSVSVTSNGVNLELDNGKALALGQVTSIANGTTPASVAA